MDKEFLAGITQATALTRTGDLAEATALIQRTLAGGSTGVHRLVGPLCAEIVQPTSSSRANVRR